MWTLVDDGNPMTNDSIRMLNSAISDGVIKSELVLNENLITAISSGSNGTETFALLAASGEYDIMPLAVGGTPSTELLAINFYIVLDGELTFINSGTLTYNNSNYNNQARKEYCSYAHAANAYTSVLVTGVSQTNIGDGYYFRYTTSEPAGTGSFSSSASYISSNVHFANTNNPQYAILSSSSRRTTPINFYTVTLDMSEVSGSTQQQYVESGMDSTFTLSDDYLWYDDDGNVVSDSAIENISAAVTLHARPKGNTVSFVTNGGTAISRQIIADGDVVARPADPTREGYIFGGWYTDSSCTNTYDFDTTVYSSFSLYAKWTPRSDYTFTYTYTDTNGNITKTEYANNLVYDTSVILPDLPAGFVWVSEGESFAAGDSVTVKGNRTFTAAQKIVSVSYNVNFPSGDTGYYGAVYPASPLLLGTSVTEIRDSVASGNTVTVRDVSTRMPSSVASSHGAGFRWQTYFVGWESENGSIIEAATRLSWTELMAYDENGDDVVEFIGLWAEPDIRNHVNFCIAYTSVLSGTGGNKENYTPSLYGSYLGGDIDTGFSESAEDGTEAYEADQRIRAMYGMKSEGMWLYGFPSDEYIFEQLKNHVDRLTVEGEDVSVEDLDSDHYAIRWSVMFYRGDDGWHLDGRLVKKVGVVHVEKTFAGDDALIELGKENFSISATNDSGRSETLVLGAASAGQTAPYFVSDDGLTYIWHISDVDYGEGWTISELREAPANASVYTEYSIYDSKGVQSAVSRHGTSVEVFGVTYAPDEGGDHVLRAEFRNFYLSSDSIAIKKEDGSSGQPIGGARFQLWQNIGGADVLLTFSEDAEGRLYFDQSNGTISEISTGDSGYSEIIIEDFSYEAGPVKVVEVGAPSGYTPAPVVVLQQTADTTDPGDAAEIVSVGGEAYDADDPDDHMYAEYYSDAKVLVIKNYSQKTSSVTAKKTWLCDEILQTDTVTVALYANGVLASSLVPNVNPVAVLDSAHAYTHTWQGLPLYINGETVTWSIKETRVGSETRTSDDSFVNWIDTYNRHPVYDADGDLENLTLEVVNDVRRTLLNVEKTDASGLTALSGAEFRLQQVSAEGGTFAPVSGGYDSTGTSNNDGWVTFDNLTAGYYMLSESSPPSGYDGLDRSVYLYVDASGKIKQVAIQEDAIVTLPDGEFESGLSRPNDFVIRVPNQKLAPLPTTGGEGNAWLYLSGALLVVYVAAGFILRLRRKDGDADA